MVGLHLTDTGRSTLEAHRLGMATPSFLICLYARGRPTQRDDLVRPAADACMGQDLKARLGNLPGLGVAPSLDTIIVPDTPGPSARTQAFNFVGR
jgi:L-alanine-DL-glutamate epimerase-like enolase superfamily enzyme